MKQNVHRNIRSVGCLAFIAFSNIATLAASSRPSEGSLQDSLGRLGSLGSHARFLHPRVSGSGQTRPSSTGPYLQSRGDKMLWFHPLPTRLV